MMSNILFGIVLILFSISAMNLGTGSSSSSSAEQNFTFQKKSFFVDESKLAHVFGEVKNTSNRPVTDIIVQASFYDSHHILLNKFKRSTDIRTLNPGDITPFEILYYDFKTVDLIHNYTLSAIGKATAVKPKALHIESYNSRIDILGFYYVNGIISNKGPEPATDTLVIATMYDKNGNVISIGRAMAEPVNITSHSEAAFGIAVTDKLQTYKVKNFSLSADSDQYGFVS
jgi:hypothetical protein